MSTIGGRKIATKTSGHCCPGPAPAMSLVPPTPPAGPVPAPFAYISLSISASETSSKLQIMGGQALVKGSKMDILVPGNLPSQPTGGDVVTHMVNKATGVIEGSSKVKAGGAEVACTGHNCRMNMPIPRGMVAQTIGPLVMVDAILAASDPSTYAAKDLVVLDPVSVITGAVVDENVDLALSGPVPLRWVRAYSSARLRDHTPMGRGGWTHSYDQWLEVEQGRIRFRDADACVLEFAEFVSGVPVLHRARGLELTVERDGTATVRAIATGEVRHFARDGVRARLVRIEAPGGLGSSFEYERGRLVRVVDAAGRRVEVSSNDQGQIVGIDVVAHPPHDPNAGGPSEEPPATVFSVRYDYDDEGTLTAFTDARGFTERYAYDLKRRLIRKTLPTGLAFRYEYDDESNRCIRSVGDGGLHEGNLRYDGERGVTSVTGTERPQTFTLGQNGTVTKVESADGASRDERAYDDDGLLLAATNGAGESVRYAYDERGHQTLFVDEGGVETRFVVTGDRRVRRTHAGLSVESTYDARGNLAGIDYPTGAFLRFDYDKHGRLSRVSGPDGVRTEFAYDEHHNPIQQRFARGGVERFAYDALGHTVAHVDPLGRVRRWDRDPYGRALAVLHPDGTRESFDYDALGRLVTHVDAKGRVRHTEFAGLRGPTRVGLSDGQAFSLELDRVERPLRIENPQGEAFEFRYDRAGNVREMATFDGRILRYQRDRAQRVSRVEYADGSWRSFRYDGRGNLAEEDSPDGAIVLSVSDDGRAFTFELDDPPGPVSLTVEQDAFHRVVRESVGEHWVAYEYDTQNRCVARRLSTGHVTRFVYDEESRVAALEHQGYRVEFVRDAAGLVVQRRFLGGGIEERRAFDAMARLERQWVGSGEGAVSDRLFRWDATGMLVERNDAAEGLSTYRYDDQDRLVEAVSPLGHERFRYDRAGAPFAEGSDTVSLPGSVLARVDGRAFEHDRNNRRTREVGSERTASYRWDARGRLRKVAFDEGGEIRFTYDPFGRRIRKEIVHPTPTDPTVSPRPPRVVEFIWSGETLVAEIDSERGTRSFVYEPMALTPLLHEEGGAIHAVVTDPVGTVTELIAPGGVVAWGASRSVWGIPIAEKVVSRGASPRSPFGLLGQYHDEETGLEYVRHRYFDARVARFLSPDPMELEGGMNLFAFCGNPTTHVDPLGLACILIGSPNQDGFLNFIMNHRQPRPGTYEVYVHGTSTGIWSNTQGHQTPADLVNRINLAGNYDAHSPIVLNSCNTGRTPMGPGQQLSQAYHTTVYAPNDLVWGQGPGAGGSIGPAQGMGPRDEYLPGATTPVYDPTRPGQWNSFSNGQGAPGNVYRPTSTYTPPAPTHV